MHANAWMPKATDPLSVRLRAPAAATTAPWRRVAQPRRSAAAGAPQPAATPLSDQSSDGDGATRAAKLARVHAALLIAREPLSTRKLAEVAELADGSEARVLVRELAKRLERRGSAVVPVDVAHGVLLTTQPQLADWLAKVHGPEDDLRLSAPAMETLAVVAYRQPATRADVEAIRGVRCGEILRVLMERDLLRIVGRSDELGRPFLYGTTRRFLQVFGLARLEQLPAVDQIRSARFLQEDRAAASAV